MKFYQVGGTVGWQNREDYEAVRRFSYCPAPVARIPTKTFRTVQAAVRYKLRLQLTAEDLGVREYTEITITPLEVEDV